MKRLTLLAALVCGVSLGSAKAESLTEVSILTEKTEVASAKFNNPNVIQPFFQLDTYQLEACGHKETLYMATKEDAAEYQSWMILTYC